MRRMPIPLLAVMVAGIAAAGCAHLPPADPQIATDTLRLRGDARALFATLATSRAPACGFAANTAAYDALKGEVATLRGRVAPGDAAMLDSVDALARTVDGAAHSHELASARTDDANGVCLAPGAIPLNAGAVDRAAEAVLTLERKREGM